VPSEEEEEEEEEEEKKKKKISIALTLEQIVTVSRQLLQNVYNVNCTLKLSVFLSEGVLHGLGITCMSQKV
jgi:hypothetical protein